MNKNLPTNEAVFYSARNYGFIFFVYLLSAAFHLWPQRDFKLLVGVEINQSRPDISKSTTYLESLLLGLTRSLATFFHLKPFHFFSLCVLFLILEA